MWDIELFPHFKGLLNVIAIIFTLIAYGPYIHSIYKGTTKPHVFTWVIWSITTFIVFLAQLADDGGVGAWSIGLSGIISCYIALLAYLKKADITITRSDWFFFITALAAIPLWYFSANPLWAVLVLTTIDVIGFAPTFRKTYNKPFEEQLLLHVLTAIRNFFAIAALENYSLTTLTFPVVMIVACLTFTLYIMVRRHRVSSIASVDRS